ncbi:hypothetical protein [Pelotalea chapellei]|uniref:Uncharacterized protein n=1 Tax=Pelotalea chapellei TaxID=44671 RepID=A0ABS5U764_9BACT|nr:hypothetical protein [Pelotalea chapellei]MBT1071494.1 hypothetical protein [Pelotalea chapellei]
MNDQPKEKTLHKLRSNLVEMRDGLLELQSALEKLHRALQYKQRVIQEGFKHEGMENAGNLIHAGVPLRENPAALTDLVRRMADSRNRVRETKN